MKEINIMGFRAGGKHSAHVRQQSHESGDSSVGLSGIITIIIADSSCL